MKIAKLIDGELTIFDHSSLFPHTSFPSSGPNDDFLLENDVFKVIDYMPFDSETQKLQQVEPYLYENIVFTVSVVSMGPDELIRKIVDKTQERLDGFAATRNYDGILSACTYATSGIDSFRLEGLRAVQLRDQTWATLYSLLAEVQSGIRPPPTRFSDVENLLPELTW
jgi:hypothetical protein